MEKLPEHRNEDLKKRAFQFINTVIDFDSETFDNVNELKIWKLNNQVNIVLKAIEYFNTLQLHPKKLKIKEISKFLEYCSFENEESMQYKWAALLANALNPSNERISLIVFIELLNQLSYDEINILELLYESSFQESSTQKAELSRALITRYLKIPAYLSEILLDNLTRLQLIQTLTKKKKTSNLSDPYYGEQESSIKEELNITLSSLGLVFIKNINFEL